MTDGRPSKPLYKSGSSVTSKTSIAVRKITPRVVSGIFSSGTFFRAMLRRPWLALALVPPPASTLGATPSLGLLLGVLPRVEGRHVLLKLDDGTTLRKVVLVGLVDLAVGRWDGVY